MCLWIFCGIPSAPQSTTHGFLISSKSLPLLVLLIFFTQSVGRLWICSCLGRSHCLGPFGSRLSFLWSSIQARVLLVCIYSFLMLACREWRWIYWIRNHVLHHGLAFSGLMFFLVSFCVNRCVFLLLGFLRVLLVLLSCCLSIRLFCYVSFFLVAIITIVIIITFYYYYYVHITFSRWDIAVEVCPFYMTTYIHHPDNSRFLFSDSTDTFHSQKLYIGNRSS